MEECNYALKGIALAILVDEASGKLFECLRFDGNTFTVHFS